MRTAVVDESPVRSSASVACALARGTAGQSVGSIPADKYGPLHLGELELGREWGVELGRSMR